MRVEKSWRVLRGKASRAHYAIALQNRKNSRFSKNLMIPFQKEDGFTSSGIDYFHIGSFSMVRELFT